MMRSLRWGSRFTDACRQAERYRDGRVLLAGDAAHIHPPTGGQGLNLGLQDSVNLGWKLAMVASGKVDDALLDSYHLERHAVGSRVISNTRAQGVLLVPDDDVACLRQTFLELIQLPDTNRRLAATIAGLDIHYASANSGNDRAVGTRMPDLDLITEAGPTTVAE